jgi:hypothetical protein
MVPNRGCRGRGGGHRGWWRESSGAWGAPFMRLLVISCRTKHGSDANATGGPWRRRVLRVPSTSSANLNIASRGGVASADNERLYHVDLELT